MGSIKYARPLVTTLCDYYTDNKDFSYPKKVKSHNLLILLYKIKTEVSYDYEFARTYRNFIESPGIFSQKAHNCIFRERKFVNPTLSCIYILRYLAQATH
ncbi:hypothetical protein AXFE_25950 [Acidithrix ferrooxidans]|uniref:Uncharacterized protein n=1 Tax=Acidithrix ferrooxidans TaxID=1280514 RepID=A0A0D8HFG7_9ACTN|nr:hypothetical protein AXFE_25950 [Acidithrix ferrooxidans]